MGWYPTFDGDHPHHMVGYHPIVPAPLPHIVWGPPPPLADHDGAGIVGSVMHDAVGGPRR